jgi:hypothetical protein
MLVSRASFAGDGGSSAIRFSRLPAHVSARIVARARTYPEVDGIDILFAAVVLDPSARQSATDDHLPFVQIAL